MDQKCNESYNFAWSNYAICEEGIGSWQFAWGKKWSLKSIRMGHCFKRSWQLQLAFVIYGANLQVSSFPRNSLWLNGWQGAYLVNTEKLFPAALLCRLCKQSALFSQKAPINIYLKVEKHTMTSAWLPGNEQPSISCWCTCSSGLITTNLYTLYSNVYLLQIHIHLQIHFRHILHRNKRKFFRTFAHTNHQ